MRRKLLSILLACILALGVGLPVLAGDPPDVFEVGDKIVLDNNIISEYLGKDAEGNYLWRATIGGPQYLDDLETLIRAKWLIDGNGDWFSDTNLFDVTVKKGKVTVEKDGQKLHWDPDIKVDGKTYKAISDMPILLFTDPVNSNYTFNTLEWDFGIAKRQLRLIEGALFEYFIFDTNPSGDVEIRSGLYKEGNFIWDRSPFAYDVEGKPIAISPDKVVLASEFNREDITYPVTIDPTSTFTTSSSDGDLRSSSVVFATAHDNVTGAIYDERTTLKVGMNLDGSIYRVARGFVYFDTSGLPDGATISSATLKLRGVVFGDNSDTDFNIQIQIGSGTPPTYPHDPMVAGDYLYTQYSSDGGTFNTAGYDDSAYNSLILNVTGRGWISKTGMTKFALLSDEDVNNSAPTGDENVYFYCYEAGDGYWPQLEVVYAASAVPVVTTDPATYVAKYSARLNSTLDDDGGEANDVRFQYYFGGGTWTDNETTWVDDTYLTGETPWVDVSSLTANTLYNFRVQARNTQGTTSGSSVSFTTELAVAAPTNLKAFPDSDTIGLTWTRGVGATDTLIKYSETDYPADETEGILSYEGALSTHTITGLTAGHNYYIVAISKSGADYSSTVEVLATTSASVAAVSMPDAPPTPEGMFQEPSPSDIPNFPGYEMFNEVAADLEIPLETWWLYMILSGVGFAAFMFYKMSHNLLVVMIVVVLGISWGSLIGILPLWWMFVVIMLGIGLYNFEARRT